MILVTLPNSLAVGEITYDIRRLVTIFCSLHHEYTVHSVIGHCANNGEHQSADRGVQVGGSHAGSRIIRFRDHDGDFLGPEQGNFITCYR